jgi:hypothetical protein
MTEPSCGDNKLDAQLDIAPFLTKFANLAKEHAYFCRQGFTELIEVLFNLQLETGLEYAGRTLTPCTLNGTCTFAVDCTVSSNSLCCLSVSSRHAVYR